MLMPANEAPTDLNVERLERREQVPVHESIRWEIVERVEAGTWYGTLSSTTSWSRFQDMSVVYGPLRTLEIKTTDE